MTNILKKYMQDTRLSLDDLEAMTGINRSTLWRITEDKVSTSLDNARIIKDKLGVDLLNNSITYKENKDGSKQKEQP